VRLSESATLNSPAETRSLDTSRPAADAQPLVSVIVLNYNGESIIERCLDALLAQSYANYEIIVVDNNSTDRSLSILQGYLKTGRVTLVRSARNRGVPGGRNLGLLHAEGTIVAFIDNDGYARPDWLTEGINTLLSGPQVGAVAPLVFFARNPLILNGAGGTLNLQGYGGDLCFNTPYEFATIPSEVLYPMGCGMIFRRTVLDQVGQFDSCLFNYYDDVDLGIRIWKAGYKVVVSRRSWIDHDFSYTNAILKNKVLLCERNRLRTILKHFSAAYILRWLVHDIPYSMRYFLTPSLRTVPIRAWSWNLFHLISALVWRARFASGQSSFHHLLDATWGSYPLPTADNQSFRPSIQDSSDTLVIDGHTEVPQLQFGWHCVEHDGAINFRWTEAHASALFALASPAALMTFRMRAASPVQLLVRLRSVKDLETRVSRIINPVSTEWNEWASRVDIEPGLYEMVLSANGTTIDSSGRRLGIAIAHVAFTST
jgi:GT2 family glycosyltransferase